MSKRSYSVAIFFNPLTKQVLIHHRDMLAPITPNMWALFGGGMEPEDKEDATVTLIREIKEELNVNLIKDIIVPFYDLYNADDDTHRYVFSIETDLAGQTVILNEGSGYAWMDIGEALTLNITEFARLDLENFAKQRGLVL